MTSIKSESSKHKETIPNIRTEKKPSRFGLGFLQVMPGAAGRMQLIGFAG